MTLSALLQQTAIRYEAAVQEVLKEWSPECGCSRPGAKPQCEACPSLALFERHVVDKLQQMKHENSQPPSTSSSQPHESTTCIYLSRTQV